MSMTLFRRLLLPGVLAIVVACDSSETTAPHHHDPVSARLYVGGTDVTDALDFTAGQVVRVEVKLYDDEDDEITGLEADHFTALVFTPGALATVTPVAGHTFQWDVTGSAAGAGTVSVGYGHDAAADTKTFGPFDISFAAP